ncbi:FCD domain-containing protein [Thermanaerosceptrum fracticalcis]|uniref:FCD domain-containing protein n=1 Tax=Thermanaerosceptrum fracticalcis TaxID=1712410 RepID=A0A7G6E2X1_THEFR|nr:FCD domain-containing protein [Thermanaerosceptrum fracticalcis]QNB46425.1 FCD domain-containing protein [Thermanaerosceptrum fracticalcis]
MTFADLGEKEIMILKMIKDAQEPMGSWNILNRFTDDGIETSSATIGRILNKLENLGYLKKEKFRGRTITEKGLHAIQVSKQLKDMALQQSKLTQFIDPQCLGDFLTVLEARRAIERETAKKAALYASKQDIQHMEEVLQRQEAKYQEHQWITEDDISFHKAIARASRNSILESMYSLLAIFGQQSRAFELLREKIHAEYMVSHRRILNAIKNGDPNEAEEAMLAHIDNLVADVKKYWEVTFRKKRREEA